MDRGVKGLNRTPKGQDRVLSTSAESIARAYQELVDIERKVWDMEKTVAKPIPSDKFMSTGVAVRHLLHVEVKGAVEKIISIIGISDSQIPPYPGILDNMSIAKRWLQNTRKALDMHKLSHEQQVKGYNEDNINPNSNRKKRRSPARGAHRSYPPDEDYGR